MIALRARIVASDVNPANPVQAPAGRGMTACSLGITLVCCAAKVAPVARWGVCMGEEASVVRLGSALAFAFASSVPGYQADDSSESDHRAGSTICWWMSEFSDAESSSARAATAA